MQVDWIGYVGPQYKDWYDTENQAELQGITVARLRNDLSKMSSNDNEFVVNLSSEGGQSDIGLSVMNLIRIESKQRRQQDPNFRSVVNVIGIAYSAASIICQGFDEIVMHTGSEMMIHRASMFCYGNVEDIEKMIPFLRGVDNNIASVYAEKTGLDIDTVLNLMSTETFISADEAVKQKFATKKESINCKVAPPERNSTWNYNRYLSRNIRNVHGTYAFFTPPGPDSQSASDSPVGSTTRSPSVGSSPTGSPPVNSPGPSSSSSPSSPNSSRSVGSSSNSSSPDIDMMLLSILQKDQ